MDESIHDKRDREADARDEPPVTDDEIQAIIDQNEAGIGDLIAAYEPIERQYFNVVQTSAATVTYSTDTQPR
jgi:hypothetical protein